MLRLFEAGVLNSFKDSPLVCWPVFIVSSVLSGKFDFSVFFVTKFNLFLKYVSLLNLH